jgi:hypothetical protein
MKESDGEVPHKNLLVQFVQDVPPLKYFKPLFFESAKPFLLIWAMVGKDVASSQVVFKFPSHFSMPKRSGEVVSYLCSTQSIVHHPQ